MSVQGEEPSPLSAQDCDVIFAAVEQHAYNQLPSSVERKL